MSNILLPILPGQLADGFCFVSWQQVLNDFSNAQQALLVNGRSFYNYGDTKPAPEYQAYPWLRSIDMRWYRFDGVWISNNWRLENEHHWEEFGAESDVWSWDGGDGTDPRATIGGAANPAYVPPTDRSGAMWMVDHNYDGRSPMSPGAIPTTDATASKTLTPEENYGDGWHRLTEAQGAVGAHQHFYGVADPTASAAAFAKAPGAAVTVPAYSARYIGGNAALPLSETTADMQTLPSGVGGAGNTNPDPTSIVHPVRGMFCLIRTARKYYVVP